MYGIFGTCISLWRSVTMVLLFFLSDGIQTFSLLDTPWDGDGANAYCPPQRTFGRRPVNIRGSCWTSNTGPEGFVCRAAQILTRLGGQLPCPRISLRARVPPPEKSFQFKTPTTTLHPTLNHPHPHLSPAPPQTPMPRRTPSPTGSEPEFDISTALADHDFLSDDDDNTQARKTSTIAVNDQSVNDILDVSDDDEAFIAAQQAASNRKGSNLKGKTVKKGGGFQQMGSSFDLHKSTWGGRVAANRASGLNLSLLKAITRKGFSVPTPIQRKTIPLVLEGLDVVGMARTGSGKTAAFVIPMVERLKAHSVKVGARAVILSPSRELALQTLKVVKELGRGTDLKCVLLVGGDSLEDQFGFMASNPDM